MIMPVKAKNKIARHRVTEEGILPLPTLPSVSSMERSSWTHGSKRGARWWWTSRARWGSTPTRSMSSS
jgi:hypothetical protein